MGASTKQTVDKLHLIFTSTKFLHSSWPVVNRDIYGLFCVICIKLNTSMSDLQKIIKYILNNILHVTTGTIMDRNK